MPKQTKPTTKDTTTVEEVTLQSVTELCNKYVIDNNLKSVLGLDHWNIEFVVLPSYEEEPSWQGFCEYDFAYHESRITLVLNNIDTIEEAKDTLMHELCHLVLAELDDAATSLISTIPENMQSYIAHKIHIAREHNVISLTDTFRSIFK